ncbi:MAG: DUF488 domain-containing protein [Nitrososphaeraceae archaeon]|nr:DUF488 domain-containing protein [Nitrososphaeraceae archaeon]
MGNPTIFTIGHSNRSWDAFLSLLLKNNISIVANIRRFSSSRLWPQSNRDHMKIGLAKHNIEYMHIVKLGGRRKEKDKPHLQENDNNNYAWRNKSFRAYANYMSTEEFKEGISELLSLKKDDLEGFIVIMCVEALPWRCHCRLISDYLSARNFIVCNIIDGLHQPSLHKITPFALFEKVKVTYPASND